MRVITGIIIIIVVIVRDSGSGRGGCDRKVGGERAIEKPLDKTEFLRALCARLLVTQLHA